MSNERTYTIQIRMNADTAGGAEAAAVLDDLQAKAGGAAIPLDDVSRALSGMSSVDVGPTKEGIAGLGGAIDKLSREDSRGTVTGLTNAILGLASGNTAQGLSGASRAMYYLTNAIPNPAVVLGASLAIGALAAVFKSVWQGADDATESLNDFGETLDEEMERLEKWANSNLEWDGIKEGNKKLKEDFDLVKSTAENAQKAIENLFSVRSQAEESDLRAKAKAADEAGDEALSAQLTAAADLLEKKRELVNQNLRILALEAEIAAQQERAEKAAENYQEKMRLADQMQARMDDIVQGVEARTGSPNAYTDKDTRQQIFDDLQAQIKTLESQQAVLSMQGGGTIPGQPWLDMESVTASLEQAKAFAAELKDFDGILKAAEEALQEQKTAQAESNAEATKASDAQILATTQLKAWREELERTANETDPEVARQAAAQAGAMAGAIADVVERAQGLSLQDIEGLAASVTDAVTAIDLVTTSVPEAMAKLKEIYEEWWLAEKGTDLSPLLEQARQFHEVIKILGSPADQQAVSSPDEVLASIRDNWDRMGQAVADGAEAVSQDAEAAGQRIAESIGRVGAEVAKGGDKFVAVAAQIDSDASRGMSLMSQGANAMASAVGHFSSTAESMLRQLASVAAMAAEAEAKAARALQQIAALR